MTNWRLPNRMPPWLRQCGRALVALVLGTVVGLSASEPKLLLLVAAALAGLFIAASLRRPDPLVFLAFFAIAVPKMSLPGSPIPLGESLMMLATFSAFLTLREGLAKIPRWAGMALGSLFAAFVLSGFVNALFQLDMFKRLLHMLVYVLVIAGLARGLLSWRIALRGIQVGLIFAVSVSIVLLPVSTYQGRLTGLFGDPNVAGMLIVVLGGISLWGITRRRNQVIYGGILAVGLFLTYSRTAILAAILATAWVVIGRKLRPIPALGAVIVVTLAVALTPTSLQQIGPFSDRTGSDLLRDRVTSQEFQAVKQKPIIGHGPGTATVMVNFGTTQFFFHNSYLALLNESGGVGMFFFAILMIGLFLSLVALETTDREPLFEASLIGIAVVALNLGEVLVELGAATAIGFALAYLVRKRAPSVDLVPMELVR